MAFRSYRLDPPEQCGDAREVVAIIAVDLDGLAWLVSALPENDGFRKDLRACMARVDERIEALEEIRNNANTLSLRVVDKGSVWERAMSPEQRARNLGETV